MMSQMIVMKHNKISTYPFRVKHISRSRYISLRHLKFALTLYGNIKDVLTHCNFSRNSSLHTSVVSTIFNIVISFNDRGKTVDAIAKLMRFAKLFWKSDISSLDRSQWNTTKYNLEDFQEYKPHKSHSFPDKHPRFNNIRLRRMQSIIYILRQPWKWGQREK
jgi:hypothetical protein